MNGCGGGVVEIDQEIRQRGGTPDRISTNYSIGPHGHGFIPKLHPSAEGGRCSLLGNHSPPLCCAQAMFGSWSVTMRASSLSLGHYEVVKPCFMRTGSTKDPGSNTQTSFLVRAIAD